MPSKKNSTRTNLSTNQGQGVPSRGGRPDMSSASMASSRRSRPSGGSSRQERQSLNRNRQLQQQQRHVEEEDDISEVSDGDPADAYGAEVDDEPQFKYSTAELADRSPRNTTCCLVTICVLCLILAIGLSVMMVKLLKKSDEDNAPAPSSPTAAPGSGGSTAGQGALTATLNEVNFECAQGSEQCANVCSEFLDCCDPMANSQAGCFFGNRLGCLDHARCHTLDSGIDAPGTALEAACSKTKVADDPTQCQSLCNQVQCCWNDDDGQATASCAVNNFYACLDYLPCQHLRGAASTVPLPSPGLEQICNSQMGGMSQVEQCDIACKPAECCWEAGIGNCLQDNFFTCLAYEPCGELTLPPAFSAVQDPGEDLSALCYGPLKNEAQCESKCNLGSCCYDDPSNSCFDEDPLGCLHYEPCKNL